MTEVINSVSSGLARTYLQDETGRHISRDAFRKLFALMVESGHAIEASRRGDSGHVLISVLGSWVTYLKRRETMIESGAWKTNRPHSIADFKELTEDNHEDTTA